MKKSMLLFIAFLVCIPFLAGCEKEDVKVGFVGCLTGTNSELGVSGMYGAQLAVDQINQAGGVSGQNLELITKDDKGDKKIAVKVDQELKEEGCIAVIGHMTSDMAELAVPYINENHFLMISPTIALPSLSGIDDFFFRLIPSTKDQAERIAQAISDQDLGKVQIVYSDQNVVFANCINTCLLENLSKNNIETDLIGSINVKKYDSNYENKIASILNSDSDALVIIASADVVSELAQSLYQNGCNKKVFLPAWAMTNDLVKRGGPSVEGFYGVNFVDYDSESERYVKFKEEYTKKYGADPTFASILSYESVIVLTSAMDESASYNADDLKASILKTGKFDGLQSKLKINGFGDIEREIYLYQVRDGKFIKAEKTDEK